MVVLLVSSGSTMVILGIFGEYLWRALEEVRGRPRFLIEDEVNLVSAP
jgi:dolichol-phosphate mannosyltransferase